MAECLVEGQPDSTRFDSEHSVSTRRDSQKVRLAQELVAASGARFLAGAAWAATKASDVVPKLSLPVAQSK